MLTLYIITTLLISAIMQTFIQCVSWFAFYCLVKYWEKERDEAVHEWENERSDNNANNQIP